MKVDDSWSEDEWKQIDSILSEKECLYRKEFKEWLKQRLQFWEKYISLGFECRGRNDTYGYSALALLRITEGDNV